MVRTQLGNNAASLRFWFRLWRKSRLGMVRLLYPCLPQHIYMRWLVHMLRTYGMQILGMPIYISPKCFFDGTDYSLIVIEDQAVISSYVSVLTHDFSLARIRDALAGVRCNPEVSLVKGVHIGRNTFVGRGAILMPGSSIGDNCIVGAGSVVRGVVPPNSIVIGNPAVVVGNSLEWGKRKLQEMGFEV